jgi:hypothetical protein
LTPQRRRFALVCAMQLKDVLERIQPDADDRHVDGSIDCVVDDHSLAQFDAFAGRPHQQSLPLALGSRFRWNDEQGSDFTEFFSD